MHYLTKQGVRNLDRLEPRTETVPIDHACKQWRWFNPPKDAPKVVVDGETQDPGPEMRCVTCRKPWFDAKPPAVAPQVKSLEKLAPGLKKAPKAKQEALVQTSLKAPLVGR